MKVIDSSFSTLNTKSDFFLSCKVLPMSLCESKDPSTSRRYYIQGTIPSNNGCVPLLWFPVDTVAILEKSFCGKAAAFGCKGGGVIILDLTQLNLQETA